MSHCCGDSANKKRKSEAQQEEQPKSRIGKYLYAIGKKEEKRGLKKNVKDEREEKHDCC